MTGLILRRNLRLSSSAWSRWSWLSMRRSMPFSASGLKGRSLYLRINLVGDPNTGSISRRIFPKRKKREACPSHTIPSSPDFTNAVASLTWSRRRSCFFYALYGFGVVCHFHTSAKRGTPGNSRFLNLPSGSTGVPDKLSKSSVMRLGLYRK